MLTPLSSRKWSFTTAAHLLNRAGFGGPPAEIDRLVKLGRSAAVDWFVNYEEIPDATPNPEWARPDPERRQKFEAARKGQRRGNAAVSCAKNSNSSGSA